jgi:flagellar M-ring protein FliF
VPQQFQAILDNLRALGPKRLAILGGVGAAVLLVIIAGSVWLNRPAHETLYVGLDRADVNQIGMVLGEAGIDFDVSADGGTVTVPVGRSGPARAILAEKGLPASSNAGYELFDNVGSFGLTTFMQQVTRVRALEGEIARTIQSITGVRSARVHIVLPERASFRSSEQEPTASVIIRMQGGESARAATAIRHLVAAAVPGLNAEKVTVLDTSGTLLAAGDDPTASGAGTLMGFERSLEAQVEDNIRRALSPYLGYDNFRASVRAEVNTDSRQIEETTFDPESQVARSVQIVRSNEQANQRQAAPPTTVQQNLPEETPTGGQGPESSEQNERREETTNFELNSRRVATISNGYTLTRLSVAVVVNRDRIAAIAGGQADPAEIDRRIAEIQTLVSTAAGFSADRGDIVNVSAVEFVGEAEAEAAAAGGVTEWLSRNAGTMINAGAFVVVVLLVSLFGLRPLTTALLKRDEPAVPALAGGNGPPAIAAPGEAPQIAAGGSYLPDQMGDDIGQKLKPAPQERLARMVDLNEERTALILRKWANKEAA